LAQIADSLNARSYKPVMLVSALKRT